MTNAIIRACCAGGRAEDQLQAKNEALKKFAREIIQDYCWNLGDPDGGSIQELAEKLGLITPYTVTVEDCDEWSDYDEGDTIYKFAEILEGE